MKVGTMVKLLEKYGIITRGIDGEVDE